jgi:hypothetical protein
VRGGRAASVAVVLLVCVVVMTASCADSRKSFCNDLRANYRLTALRDAINRNDTKAIESALDDLETLADQAPKSISVDLRVVVDTVVSTVREVTNVTSPGGEKIPPDLVKLNASLAKVSESSQRVVAWADRDCDLQLDR